MSNDEFPEFAHFRVDPPPGTHEQCATWLKAQFAQLGCDVTVTLAAPLMATPYDQDPFVCPHGTVFWHAPTSEQMALWARDGVA